MIRLRDQAILCWFNKYVMENLIMFLGKYGLKPNDLARICDINSSQMRQYAAGLRKPGPKTIDKINERIRVFADELKEFQITDV